MNQEEEEVIHLDYNSEDEYEIPDNDDESESEAEEEEGESEAKLMEYLLKGLVLQSSTCGSCDTPLIKSLVADENPKPITPDSKIEPIGNIPFCVACCAHVVTTKTELQMLWKDEYKALMGIDGAVLLYMDDEVQQQPVFGKMTLAAASESEDEAAGVDLHVPEAYEEEPEEEDERHEPEDQHESETYEEPKQQYDSRPLSASSAGRPISAKSSSARSMNSHKTSGSESIVLDGDEELNFDLIDYDKRRQIATKVLGAKMIEGYSLRETQCEKCTMPIMDLPDGSDVICVVCPVLQKKILKKMKERRIQKEEEMALELERLAEEEKQLEAEQEQLAKQREIEEKELAEQKAREEAIMAEKKREEEEELRAKEEMRRKEEELAAALEEEARLVEEKRKIDLQRQLEEERIQLEEIRKKRAEEAKASSVEMEEKELTADEQRKLKLREQLEAEKRRLEDLRIQREMQDQNMDPEEIQMLEELRRAREAREKEEERLREEERRRVEEEKKRAAEKKRKEEEEKARKRKAQEEERLRLIEELRLAKEARAKEEKRRQEEIKLAEKRAKDAKQAEQARELERIRLVEELRVARQERMMEEMRRKEEALKAKKHAEEAEKMIRLRDEEQSRMKAELEQSLKSQKEQERTRKEEIAKAEQKAKAAEEQLKKWRQTAEEESKRTEEVRKAAEKRARDAEQAKIDAQKLAQEAKQARAYARAEKARLSERQRLNELAHRAEQHRLAAEAEAQKAQRALLRAEQKELKYSQERQVHEGLLSRQVHEATQKLSRFEREYTPAFSLDEKLREQEEKLDRFNDGGAPMDIDPGVTAASAGQDWDLRLEIGKSVLATRLMKGWTVLPEYCFGRMCNFTPIITKGDVTECVVCEGSGTGEDGAYEEVHPDDMMDETMTYINKKQRFEKISTSMRRVNFDASHDMASREVGRRMRLGWQLLESPCPSCLLPLMSETVGSPEVCVFCDPDDDIEIGDEDDAPAVDPYDVPDDHSYSSRRSVTIELPDNFDPSDPYAMAQLAAQATAASSGQSVASRNNRLGRPNSRQSRGREPRTNLRPRSQGMYGSPNRPHIPPGGRMVPKHMGRQGKLPMPRNTMRSQSPRPESRGAYSTARSGGNSRGRGRTGNRNPESMYVPAQNGYDDDDDASDISDNVSVAKSVASHTLDAIMKKIDDCKVTLSTPDCDAQSVARKGEAAALMQKLSAAAAAVKHLE